MTAPWTPRELALRAALWEYRQCQRRMLDKWSESDQAGKDMLWRSLHKCESLADSALSDTPPPDPRDEALTRAASLYDTYHHVEQVDPRDEALKVAETSLKRINSMATRQIAKECCGDAVTLVKITTECDAALAAIAAAKGEG